MVNYKREINRYLKKLFPIARSITGNGNRDTLRILQEIVPLKICEYPSGLKAYDWVIPKEWNIRDAWIKDSSGRKIVDFQKSNLHVVGYSAPFRGEVNCTELKEHLYYLRELPNAIPYRTTYYKNDWGFCLKYKDYRKNFNSNDKFEVLIDSELKDGHMTIGELLIKGKTSKEILISTYICHPSLANDNLSGIILTAFLAAELLKKELNFSYRIIFVPETIGAISYCAVNRKAMKKIEMGFVITTVGGPGSFSYKMTFNEQHYLNQIIEDVFADNNIRLRRYPFHYIGSDERQYSSIGFRINVASICKDKYYEYKYYHTSLDNLDFVKAGHINLTLDLYLQVIERLEKNITCLNLYPNCEMMLSKRGLYPETGGGNHFGDTVSLQYHDILLKLLLYCDGEKSLFDISRITGISQDRLYHLAEMLEKKKIVRRVN